MRSRRIQPGWRYTLAQRLLGLVFGRRWHFISPWPMAALGCGLVMLSPDHRRVLLQQRAGPVEGAGKYSLFGGYMDMRSRETQREGLAREVWEECGLRLNLSVLPEAAPYTPMMYNQSKHEMEGVDAVGFYWFAEVEEGLAADMKPSDEASAFRWVTEAELDALWQSGQFHGRENDHYAAAKRAFAAARNGEKLPRLSVEQ